MPLEACRLGGNTRQRSRLICGMLQAVLNALKRFVQLGEVVVISDGRNGGISDDG